MRTLIALLAFALIVRALVAVWLMVSLEHREFADDFEYYSAMHREPLSLLTGREADKVGAGQIYAPLMPVELLIPGWPLVKVFGMSLGHRLAMVCYDVAAVAIALGVAFAAAGSPRTKREWGAAAALAFLPVAVLSAAVWGQEDTIAAFWAALALWAWWRGRPVVAAVIGGLGLFTYKLFSLVLVAGLWLGAPGKQRSVALAGAACVAAFAAFLGLRWLNSGLFWPAYAYNQIDNHASPWAAWQLLAGGLAFHAIRPWVMGATLAVMGVWALLALRARPTLPAAVVGTHAAFFSVFLGIHPEHHQWFTPFLIYLAWESFRQRGQRLLPLACWSYGTLAYAYKIAYGLRGGESAASGGKQAIRDWFYAHVGFDLFWVQITLLFATLACGLLLCALCLRYRRPAGEAESQEMSAPAGTLAAA